MLTQPLFLLVSALAGVYTLRTTVLMPEFITGQLAAVQLYDHLYDEMMDTVAGRARGQGDSEAAEPSVVAMLEAGRYPVTIYLSDKIEGFITDLYRWLEVADAPAPVLDLTDLGQVGQPIEAELTRRDTLTPQAQAFLRLFINRAVPEEPFILTSLWADDPDTLRGVERARAAMRRLPHSHVATGRSRLPDRPADSDLGEGMGLPAARAWRGAAPGRGGSGGGGSDADHVARWLDRDAGTSMATTGRHDVRRIGRGQHGAFRQHLRWHRGSTAASCGLSSRFGVAVGLIAG